MPQTDDAGSAPAGPFRLGDWLVEPTLNRLTRGEKAVSLEPRLMDLLAFLARHPGDVLPGKTIIDAVWSQQFVGEGVLRRAVASLREALGDDAKTPTYIETISKRGYRLIAEPVAVGEVTDQREAREGQPPREPAPEPGVGVTLSHYRILEHLGGGGMGVVYRAEDTKLDRMVALKFLTPECNRDPDARERFMREAKAASAVDQSNICTIYEIDETDETDEGRLFIAMAYYDGETLKKKIERGPLRVHDAIGLCIQIVEGLQRAHEAGIVHRDVKPANVIITDRGEVKIVDFGLAKLAGELSLTRTGTTLGTVFYMSPEQSRGEKVDHRSDVWSLGVVLYEMVTGLRPFNGDNDTAVMRAILDDEPRPLSELRPDAPQMLERIVRRALDKDPERRYASADDLFADLRALDAVDSEAGLDTVTTRQASATRRRWITVAAPVAGVVMLAVVALVLWRVQRAPPPEPTEEGPQRIVVLAFENLGPPEEEYFADGMTEEITSWLATLSGLEVISRTSAMHCKGTNKKLEEIGADLNVDYVLEGSVRWERSGAGGSRVRITPKLIHVESDAHVWTERYDCLYEDILEVQTDIARAIAGEIRVELTPAEETRLTGDTPTDPDAYRAYLMGRHHWGTMRLRGYQQALEYFKETIAIDPDFAPAYAALAIAYHSLVLWNYLPPSEMETSRRYALEALVRDDTSSEAHIASAVLSLWDRDPAGAEAHHRRAVELEPSSSQAHWAYSTFLWGVARRSDEAHAAARTAFELDPLNAHARMTLGIALGGLGRYDEATELTLESLELDPDNPAALFVLFHNYAVQGKHDEALEAILRYFGRGGGLTEKQLEAYQQIKSTSGFTGVMEWIARAMESSGGRDHARSYRTAVFFALAGRNQEALHWLERAYLASDPDFIMFVNGDPVFEPLRSDPLFQDLLRRMNYPVD